MLLVVAAEAEEPAVAAVAREVFAVGGGSHHIVGPVIVEKGQKCEEIDFSTCCVWGA